MKQYLLTIAKGSILTLFLAGVAAPAVADDGDGNLFVKMADKNKDGMVSKDAMMKHVEMVWAKMDKEKKSMFDAKRVEAFLKELMNTGG